MGRFRDIRVMVHDKSSLAPEGNSRAFSLENGTLHWQEGYENLTADELLTEEVQIPNSRWRSSLS